MPVFLLHTVLLALGFHPVFVRYYFPTVNEQGSLLLFSCVLAAAFCGLLILLAVLCRQLRRQTALCKLLCWMGGSAMGIFLLICLVVHVKGWGNVYSAFLLSLPGILALWTASIVRYRQFQKLSLQLSRYEYDHA